MSVGQSANCFIGHVAQALNAGGSETTMYLDSIETLTGETISTVDFATFGKVTMTIDPLSSSNIEFVSGTAIDGTNIAVTGLVRGLSAFDYTASTSRAKYHAVGTTVIIAFGTHNLLDLVTYINNLITGFTGTATDVTAGSTKLSYNMGANARARSTLVSQTSTGNMTLTINTWSYQNGSTTITFTGKTLAYINGVLTSTFVAPVSNSRYDLIVYRPSLSDCTSITGTEAASPSLPTPAIGDIILASVFHRVGETSIIDRNISPNTQGYISVWYEPTVYSTSTPLTNQQVFIGVDQSQATTNGTQKVGEANATTKASIIAQKFIPTVTGIQGAKLWKIADSGSFTGTVKVSLQVDSSGSPSGSDLASYTISNAAWLKLNAAAEFTVAFTTEYESMVAGNAYWIVITPSTSDNTNHPNLGLNTAGGYSSGALKYNNSTDGWVLVATSMLYFKTTSGVVSKIVQTDTTGLVPAIIRPYSLVSLSTTGVANSTTTETVAMSTQLEGGFWTANSGIKVTMFYDTLLNGGSNTIKVKYNGSVLHQISASPNNSATQLFSNLIVYIINNGSLSSQKSWSSQSGTTNFLSGTATGLIIATQASAQTSAIDTSQPGLLEITIQVSNTGSSQQLSFEAGTIEKIG